MTVSGSNRVIRGGSWNNDARNCRAAYRNNNTPDNRNNNIGFRLVSTRQICLCYTCMRDTFRHCQRVRFTDRACAHKALSRS